ncbi:MAG: hypothetical protein WCP36_06065 [Methanomicrobiales archaeon]
MAVMTEMVAVTRIAIMLIEELRDIHACKPIVDVQDRNHLVNAGSY